MYAPSYDFNQGGPAPSPGYNPNHGAPAPAPPLQHHQQQPQQQHQQQHMMYNSQQQYGAPLPPHPSPYSATPPNQSIPSNIPMPGNMNGGGPILQNGGMAHMAGNNGIAPYQTPYSSSPYPQGMPPSSGPPHQQPYMPQTSNAPQYSMPPQNMTPQPHQRMQPPQAMGASGNSAQRVSPYGGAAQNTPPHAQQPSQFMTPQNPNSNQHAPQNHVTHLSSQGGNQVSSTSQQPQSAGGLQTPKTPSFPSNSAATNSSMTVAPLSPGSEGREKERVSLLLDINRELLLEVMRIQALQAEGKKDAAAAGEKIEGEKEKEKPPITGQAGRDYVECMRRLQVNLAYLAAIADRSHKPSSQIPPHPAIITAPPLLRLSKPLPGSKTAKSPSIKDESKPDMSNGIMAITGDENKEDRADTMKAQYARLQSLFPGVDSKKDAPPTNPTKSKQPTQQQHPNPAQQNPTMNRLQNPQNQQQMGNMQLNNPNQSQPGGPGQNVAQLQQAQMQAQAQARHQQQMMMMGQQLQQQHGNPNMHPGPGGMTTANNMVPMNMNPSMGMGNNMGNNMGNPSGQAGHHSGGQQQHMMMSNMGMGGSMPLGMPGQGQGHAQQGPR